MSAPTPKSFPRDTGPEHERSALPGEEEQTSWEATVRKDVLVGQHVGEYIVRRRIGSGGMGIVYEGEHPIIGRKVAIKLIRPDEGGPRGRDLAAEARAVSTIRHRGIIDIFGFGTHPGVGQYLVMELLSGEPLDRVLQQRAPLPMAEALRLTGEVLSALSAAHGEGIIHRDLKPGNIFLVRESQGAEYVKVLDFGLAKQAPAPHGTTPQTRASVVLGTPEYMAPEQACGQAVSPRTDLYAVGILLFEMLTGRLPFQADSAVHLLVKQIHEAPPAPSSLVEGLPPALDELVLRLLAKDAEHRPASAEDTLRELNDILRTVQWDTTRISGVALPAVRTSTARISRGAPSLVDTRPTVLSKPQSAPLAAVPSEQKTVESVVPRGAAPRRGGGLGAGGALVLVLAGGGLLWNARTPVRSPARPPVVARPPDLAPPPPAPAPSKTAPSETAPSETAPAPPSEPVAPAPAAPLVAEPPAGEVAGAAAVPQRRPVGSLQVITKCWGMLYIDGILRGRAPLAALPLRAGPHRLELKDNPGVKGERAQIVIRPGAATEFVARCQRVE